MKQRYNIRDMKKETIERIKTISNVKKLSIAETIDLISRFYLSENKNNLLKELENNLKGA